MATIKRFDNPKAIEEWIRADHKQRHGNEPLAWGIGNDMSYPTVVWVSAWQATYYPDGIHGQLVFCEVGVR